MFRTGCPFTPAACGRTSRAAAARHTGGHNFRDVVAHWLHSRLYWVNGRKVRIRHLSQWKTLRTGRVTVYTVKYLGIEGETSTWGKKGKRKQFKETILPDSPPFTYVTQLIPYLKKHFLFIIKKPALSVKNGCKLDTYMKNLFPPSIFLNGAKRWWDEKHLHIECLGTNPV